MNYIGQTAYPAGVVGYPLNYNHIPLAQPYPTPLAYGPGYLPGYVQPMAPYYQGPFFPPVVQQSVTEVLPSYVCQPGAPYYNPYMPVPPLAYPGPYPYAYPGMWIQSPQQQQKDSQNNKDPKQ